MSIDLPVLWTFTLLWLVVVPTPGANALMVTHLALTRPARDVAIAIAGNLLGVALWVLAALLGLVVLLAAFPAARLAIHVLGGAYLVYFGFRLIFKSFRANTRGTDRPGRPFVVGLATALSNAQAVFFITSIFAVAGVINTNAATGVAVLAVMVLCNGAYLGLLGWILLHPGPRRAYERWRATLERMFGVLFIAFGMQLAWKALKA